MCVWAHNMYENESGSGNCKQTNSEKLRTRSFAVVITGSDRKFWDTSLLKFIVKMMGFPGF